MEFSGQDDDLLRAIELSKQEVERHPMLESVKTERVSGAVSPIDDAFDALAALNALRPSHLNNTREDDVTLYSALIFPLSNKVQPVS